MTRKNLFDYILHNSDICNDLDMLDEVDEKDLDKFKTMLRFKIEEVCKEASNNAVVNPFRQATDFTLWLYKQGVDITAISEGRTNLEHVKMVARKAKYD